MANVTLWFGTGGAGRLQARRVIDRRYGLVALLEAEARHQLGGDPTGRAQRHLLGEMCRSTSGVVRSTHLAIHRFLRRSQARRQRTNPCAMGVVELPATAVAIKLSAETHRNLPNIRQRYSRPLGNLINLCRRPRQSKSSQLGRFSDIPYQFTRRVPELSRFYLFPPEFADLVSFCSFLLSCAEVISLCAFALGACSNLRDGADRHGFEAPTPVRPISHLVQSTFLFQTFTRL